jgi:predicted lipid carrier protein YhbT
MPTPLKSTVPTVPPLVALALRPLPLLPLQFLLARLLRRIATLHPRIFERLGVHAEKRFGIDPIDLPFAFVIEPRPSQPRLSVERALPPHIHAKVAGPLAALVGLASGDYDGDALFFSRDVNVEGDIEAVVALRNAIDDAELDLVDEVLNRSGPFNRPAREFLRGLTQTRPTSDRPRMDGQWN